MLLVRQIHRTYILFDREVLSVSTLSIAQQLHWLFLTCVLSNEVAHRVSEINIL